MTDRLEGIHALITGAASGIGAACARRMVRDGAQLLLADLNGDGAKTVADELRQASVQADVTRTDDIQRMLDLAYQRWGRLDVLVNNAGSAEDGRILKHLVEAWTPIAALCAADTRVASRAALQHGPPDQSPVVTSQRKRLP